MENNKKKIEVLLIAIVIFSEYFMLQYSCLPSFISFLKQGGWIIANYIIIIGVNLGIYMISASWRGTLLCTLVFHFIWSVANHYVILYHESPLFYGELANMKTAMNVAAGYSYEIDKVIGTLIILFLFQILFIMLLGRDRKEEKKKRRIIAGAIVALMIITFGFLLFGSSPIKPRNTIQWTWKEPVQKYGYAICFIENIDCTLHPYKEPEGYTVDAIHEVKAESVTGTGKEYPDVIFILNETFCDLGAYAHIETDINYMEPFYTIKGAFHGKAITPSGGWGTNNSEYEFLTSNSLSLLANSAPFNFLDLSKTKANIVQYFNGLGYETYAMHCQSPGNYSRNSAYKELGFDQIIMGEENFVYCSYNGNRPWLDADNYKDLIKHYESGNADTPKFMYLLTYQNHGGYTQNTGEMALVHVKSDHGNMNAQLEEYFSTIYLSATAIADLVEYFSNVDRPVVLCMVGDHTTFLMN